MNAVLYVVVVLIWGTTWIAIKAQYGELTAVIAVFWRFLIAALILFFVLLISKRLQRLSIKDHGFCVLQSVCVFGLNFICFYSAVAYINSGLESVIFSMAVLFNVINNKLIFNKAISASFYPSVTLGLLGIMALFWHDLVGTQIQWQTLWGVLLCILGTFGFSLGNMISIRHQNRGLDVFSTNAYGMLYGAIIMGVTGYVLQDDFFPMLSASAATALLYLAIFGSVIGFTAYFILVGKIGAGKAAYSTLLFPLVALSISTYWEGYVWHFSSCMGVGLILIGNYMLFAQPKWITKWMNKTQYLSRDDNSSAQQ